MQKTFKYRLYPTAEQENLLPRTMGCTRLVYNKALASKASNARGECVGEACASHLEAGSDSSDAVKTRKRRKSSEESPTSKTVARRARA
jgi:transposase